MTKVRKNSELSAVSYKACLSSGKHDRYKQAIINELSKVPRTRRELTALVHAGNPSNITAALKALENEGIIYRFAVVQDQVTGREVTQYALNRECPQEPGAGPEMSSTSLYISGTISSSNHAEGPIKDDKNAVL